MKAKFADKPVQVEWYPVKDLESAPWNPNIMDEKQYASLRDDMKAHGPFGIDPLDCGSKRLIYNDPKLEEKVVVLNGNWRLKAARELAWERVRVIIDPSVTTEDQARQISYVKNAERGSIDAFKAAENFKWFKDTRGMTEEEIAKTFNIDRTTVSKRLSLLNIAPEVKKQALSETSRGLTASHLEVIATLPEQLQKKAMETVKNTNRYDTDRAVSVRQVEGIVKATKEADERARKFGEAISKAKFPKCPKCGKPPRDSYRQLPLVECSSGNWQHEWNINTGKTQAMLMAERRAEESKGQKRSDKRAPPKPPTTFKTPHAIVEVKTAALHHFKEMVSQLTEVEFDLDAGITGKVDKVTASMSFGEGFSNNSYNFRYDLGGKEELDFEISPIKNRNKKEDKDLLCIVDFENQGVRSEKHLTELQEAFEKWLAKYGGDSKKKGK